MAGLAVTRRFDLTEAQWTVLEPLRPVPDRPGRPLRWTERRLIDAIRRRVRVGTSAGRACPGSWQAVCSLFRRWQRAGIWDQILTGPQARADAAGLIDWRVGGLHHRPRSPARRRCPYRPPAGPGGRRRLLLRAGRPQAGTLARRAGHQNPCACEQGRRVLAMAGQRGDSP
ncbi:transposase [Actinomadura macrotermitis]|uniref:transposase n=1 Tax=Actinomadura macrotermitis TaxID=2585200 RepID=UPI001A9B84AD